MPHLVPAVRPRVQAVADFSEELRRVAAAETTLPGNSRQAWIGEKDVQPELVWGATRGSASQPRPSPRRSLAAATGTAPSAARHDASAIVTPRSHLHRNVSPVTIKKESRVIDADTVVLISDEDNAGHDSTRGGGALPSATPARAGRRDRATSTACDDGQSEPPRKRRASAEGTPSASQTRGGRVARSSTSSSVQILSQASQQDGAKLASSVAPGRAKSTSVPRQTSIEDFLRQRHK